MSKKPKQPTSPDSADQVSERIMDVAHAEFDPKAVLAVMSQRPGVYRMLDKDGEVLYVGKARNLRKRVSNYFRASGLDTNCLLYTSPSPRDRG